MRKVSREFFGPARRAVSLAQRCLKRPRCDQIEAGRLVCASPFVFHITVKDRMKIVKNGIGVEALDCLVMDYRRK